MQWLCAPSARDGAAAVVSAEKKSARVLALRPEERSAEEMPCRERVSLAASILLGAVMATPRAQITINGHARAGGRREENHNAGMGTRLGARRRAGDMETGRRP